MQSKREKKKENMSDTVMIAVSPIPLFALLLLALFKSFFFFFLTTNLCAIRLTSQSSHFFFRDCCFICLCCERGACRTHRLYYCLQTVKHTHRPRKQFQQCLFS